MKYIAVVLVLWSLPLLGQEADSISKQIRIYNSVIGYHWLVSNGPDYKGSNMLVIDCDSLFDQFLRNEKTTISRPNFNEKVLIVGGVGGDCHMKLYPEVDVDTAANRINITVYNLWGGCRAGGMKTIIAEVPIPKKGMQFHFKEIQLDREEELIQYGIDR